MSCEKYIRNPGRVVYVGAALILKKLKYLKLIQWMLSEEGQEIVTETEYVRIKR